MHFNCGFTYRFIWLCLALPTLATTSQVPINIRNVLEKIVSPASGVYFPGQPQYERDTHHWTPSVSQKSMCSVEPGTAADISRIIEFLGSTRTPFAVKSGGHTVNPGFSSTPGVHISLSRIKDLSFNPIDKTATVGFGMIWDDVYAALAPYNISLVGSRAPDLGIGGFTLGEGCSYITNQYGLSMDTVVGYQLGGFNNFGIVTQITFKTLPQGAIWVTSYLSLLDIIAHSNSGWYHQLLSAHIDKVLNAVALFSSSATDPKANVVALTVGLSGQFQINVFLFYDAPQPPQKIFDTFTNIPSLTKDLCTRSMLSLVQSFAGFDDLRVTTNGIPTSFYSKQMLQAIWNETMYWGTNLPPAASPLVTYAIEPFLPTAFAHATSESAYLSAKSRSQHPNPTGIVFAYTGDTAEFDSIFQAAIKQSAAHLKKVAEGSGQASDAVTYPNYAIFDTPLVDLYGENLPRLKNLKRRIDPLNVMGLAGGWRF